MLSKDLNKYFTEKLTQYGQSIIKLSQDELRSQGHRVTGETERSFRLELLNIGALHYELSIYVKTSAIILNYGVKAQNVPYRPRLRGQGRGGVSKYIQALINWAANVKPELSAKEQKSFAFAVANKASKEGHPTKGSYAFSKNGRRTDWIQYSITMNEDMISKIVNPDNIFDLVFNSIRA